MQGIIHVKSLKLLGLTFEDNPTINWDTHIDNVMLKASSHLFILRTCKYYRYSVGQLDLLFQSLIVSVFIYAIEVWGCAHYDKYLGQIDRFFTRAFKWGFCKSYIVLMISSPLVTNNFGVPLLIKVHLCMIFCRLLELECYAIEDTTICSPRCELKDLKIFL